MASKPKPPGLQVSATFLLRTALLPFAEWTRWGSELQAAAARDGHERARALERDVGIVRHRLRALIEQPIVADALFVASPDLQHSLAHWQREPDSSRGQKVERALVRYLSRMAGRATPFGLFAAVSLGRIGESTRLEVEPAAQSRCHTRLDNDYLFALCEELNRAAEVRDCLLWWPNSSLYRAGGRLRYAEARLAGTLRSHHLVAVEPSDYLTRTLARARCGARRGELAAALCEDDPEVTRPEAEEFVDELIDGQLLVSHLSPCVTGPEPIVSIVETLRREVPNSPVADRLTGVKRLMDEMDAAPCGGRAGRCQQIAADLATLPAKAEMSRLFQVDMTKPAPNATLGRDVVAEIERGIAILYSLTRPAGQRPLDRFVQRFRDRYEDREVPLVEVLDEEIGIGFEPSRAPNADAAPLLADLAFPAAEIETRWEERDRFLLARVHDIVAGVATEWSLGPADLDALRTRDAPPLPDAFSILATLSARSADDIARGNFRVLVSGGSGPSGARLAGRFCHASVDIERAVKDHLQAEQALQPEAIFAEIVHLPEGRIGNILCRPVLREYEIPYLGLSGAPAPRQIPVGDLWVSVVGDRVVLRSRALGRRVIPRLSTAHNYNLRGLGLYRFLCELQNQGIAPMGWSWGPLEAAPFLPRVRCGRAVFSPARWLLGKEDLEPLALAARGGANTGSPPAIAALRLRQFEAIQALRQKRRLPRIAVLADGDNQLPLDLDNPLCVDSFVQLVKSRSRAILHESYPPADELIAAGPEGNLVHELLLSFVREHDPPRPPKNRAAGPAVTRRCEPGSDWLYVKLYTGTATADQVLRAVTPSVRSLQDQGAIDRWFFLRYGDPDWHLRVRIRGRPAVLSSSMWPALHRAIAPLVRDGLLWRVQLDTYEREVERYGGGAGIELAEELFSVDSRAVADIVDRLSGDEGADARWRLVVRGADLLLADLGLDLAARHRMVARARDSLGREFRVDTAFHKLLGAKFRPQRDDLAALLAPTSDADRERDRTSDLAPGFDILAARSQSLAPIAQILRCREQAGELSRPLEEIAGSFVHMHANRLLRSAHRAQELVLYDILRRLYQSRLSQEKK